MCFYSVAVSDRFSDLGIVGAAEVEGRTLTLFCLSCRALGREVENKMMEHIMDRHNIETIDFVSTNKNDKLAAGIFGGFHLNRLY